MALRSSHPVPPLAAELIARFEATFDGVPGWAWPVKPSIPFVGQRYRPGRGLLIYASAENLSWLNRAAAPARFTSPAAWNRYRVRYEEAGRDSDSFFPDVGIQPVSDGGLLAAGLFVASRLGLRTAARPRAFLETVAVSNWCKFAVRAAVNRDHIGDVKKLTCSLPYVVGELAVLRPAVVLLPKLVWAHPILAAAMRGAAPWARFLPVPQFNATVVNCHLSHHDRSARRLCERSCANPLKPWIDHLHGIRRPHAWRYLSLLADLDVVLSR